MEGSRHDRGTRESSQEGAGAPEVSLIDGVALAAIAVEVTFRRDSALGAPFGVVVRGLLGARLRDLRCQTGAPSCVDCMEASRCDYMQIFDTPPNPLAAQPTSQATHPFWLQPSSMLDHFAAGACLRVRLVACGHALTSGPWLEVALRDALRVVRSERALGTAGALDVGPANIEVISSRIARVAGERAVRVEAKTAVIAAGNEALARIDCPAAPWLATLVRAGLRRSSALTRAYAPSVATVKVPLPDLRAIERVSGEMVPWSSSRWSQRQGQRVPLRGFMGAVVLRGDAVAELAPLLRTMALTNVGKATSMGFGEISVEAV